MPIENLLSARLDPTAATPLYKQIAEQVTELIATGQLQPGEHLPTVWQLAEEYYNQPGLYNRLYGTANGQPPLVPPISNDLSKLPEPLPRYVKQAPSSPTTRSTR